MNVVDFHRHRQPCLVGRDLLQSCSIRSGYPGRRGGHNVGHVPDATGAPSARSSPSFGSECPTQPSEPELGLTSDDASVPIPAPNPPSPPTVSISTAFPPGAAKDGSVPDVIIVSSDGVFFYAHTHLLLAASTDGFSGHLLGAPTVPILFGEPAAVLNLVLHAVYNLPCAQYSPSFAELDAAVAALSTYGIAPAGALAPGAPLGQALRTLAPLHPLDVYTLAASHDALELAKTASTHLLSFPLSTLTDETAERMGGPYAKKLFFLHLGRVEALKRLLVDPPASHAPTARCGFEEQKGLTRAWALAAAYVSWEATPGKSFSRST
jgi:hypothetical protein